MYTFDLSVAVSELLSVIAIGVGSLRVEPPRSHAASLGKGLGRHSITDATRLAMAGLQASEHHVHFWPWGYEAVVCHCSAP